MTKPQLSEIIESISKREHVKMVPKFDKPIHWYDFFIEMEELVERVGLENGWPGHMVDYETARNERGDIFRDVKYHQYWVSFSTELDANRFMNRVNADNSLPYKAEPPQTRLGFAAVASEKKIS